MDRTLEALSLDDVNGLELKSLQPYKHLPLKSDFNIRLLSFSVPERSPDVEFRNPSTQEPIPVSLDDVEFDLLEVDLRAQPKYQTLSYVWGDMSVTTEMKLKGGKTIKITDNLRAALVRIVGKREKLPIWIDQLCINQSDMPERSNQVSMMGTIYLSAQHAMVWLGEEREDYTEYFMQLIHAIRTDPVEEHSKEWCKELMKSMVELKYDPERPTVKAKRWRVVQEILNRPWFQRAWVVQEAVLSKQLNMMMGRHNFRSRELVEIIRAIHSLEYELGGYIDSLAKTTTGWETLDMISDMRDHDSKTQKPNNFWQFLCSVGGRWEATEKRDMVYAFLGLLNRPELFAPLGFPVQPDYSAPLRSVYISLARTFIDGFRNLDLLSQVIGDEPFLGPKHMRISEDLPSWVPDWAISTPSIINFHNASNNSFNACKNRLYHRETSSRDPEVLIVRGKIVSKILCRVNHHFERHYFMDDDRGWLNLDGHFEHITALLAPGATDKITRERVLKTLLADGAWPRHKITTGKPSSLSNERIRELLYAYDMWPRIVADDSSLPNLEKLKNDLFDLQQYSLILQNKRLAGCLGGLLALVSRVCLIKADCEIAILHGSKVPIVMIENSERRGEWRVIGQCYLEGMMYGEGVDWEEEDADVFKIV